MPTTPQKEILGYVSLARNMPMPTPCFLVRLRYATESAQVLPTLRYLYFWDLRTPKKSDLKNISTLVLLVWGFKWFCGIVFILWVINTAWMHWSQKKLQACFQDAFSVFSSFCLFTWICSLIDSISRHYWLQHALSICAISLRDVAVSAHVYVSVESSRKMFVLYLEKKNPKDQSIPKKLYKSWKLKHWTAQWWKFCHVEAKPTVILPHVQWFLFSN